MFAFHASRSTGLPSDGSSIPGRSSSGSTHTVAALTAIRALCPGRGPRPPWPAGAVAAAGALPAPSRAAAPPAAPVAASVKPARREKRAEDRGRVGDIRISSCVSVSGCLRFLGVGGSRCLRFLGWTVLGALGLSILGLSGCCVRGRWSGRVVRGGEGLESEARPAAQAQPAALDRVSAGGQMRGEPDGGVEVDQGDGGVRSEERRGGKR